MDNKRMVYKCLLINLKEVGLDRGRPKSRWWDCVYGDTRKCKIRNWEKRSKNREDFMRSIKEEKAHIGLQSQLRRRRRCICKIEKVGKRIV
jgi:hypothetical protein